MAKDHKIDDSELEGVSGGQALSAFAPADEPSTPPSGTDKIGTVDSGGGGTEPLDPTPDLPGNTPDTGSGGPISDVM